MATKHALSRMKILNESFQVLSTCSARFISTPTVTGVNNSCVQQHCVLHESVYDAYTHTCTGSGALSNDCGWAQLQNRLCAQCICSSVHQHSHWWRSYKIHEPLCSLGGRFWRRTKKALGRVQIIPTPCRVPSGTRRGFSYNWLKTKEIQLRL